MCMQTVWRPHEIGSPKWDSDHHGSRRQPDPLSFHELPNCYALSRHHSGYASVPLKRRIITLAGAAAGVNLFDRMIGNDGDTEAEAVAHETPVLLPPRSRFLMSDVTRLRPLLPGAAAHFWSQPAAAPDVETVSSAPGCLSCEHEYQLPLHRVALVEAQRF